MKIFRNLSVATAVTSLALFGLSAPASALNPTDSTTQVQDDAPKTRPQYISAGEVAQTLKDAGFAEKKSEDGQREFSKNIDGVAVKYRVPAKAEEQLDTSTLTPKASEGVSTRAVHFGWDNGPRLYMTGTDFWNLGPAGAKNFCGKVPIIDGICGQIVDDIWNKINLTGEGGPLKDNTCYDLSQTLNVGWEKVEDKHCA